MTFLIECINVNDPKYQWSKRKNNKQLTKSEKLLLERFKSVVDKRKNIVATSQKQIANEIPELKLALINLWFQKCTTVQIYPNAIIQLVPLFCGLKWKKINRIIYIYFLFVNIYLLLFLKFLK